MSTRISSAIQAPRDFDRAKVVQAVQLGVRGAQDAVLAPGCRRGKHPVELAPAAPGFDGIEHELRSITGPYDLHAPIIPSGRADAKATDSSAI